MVDGEKYWYPAFSLFPTMYSKGFLIHCHHNSGLSICVVKRETINLATFNLSFANAFIFVQYRSLSFGRELTH